MRYVTRELGEQVRRAARAFPAVVLSGPRRAGKTFLLRHLFPTASYLLLEDPDAIARFRADPHGLLDRLRPPAILDEIQNVPEILSYVRTRIDRRPGKRGQWFLTGSQEAPLMHRVTESMAGRAAVLQLLPMSVRETPRAGLLRGGYPEAIGSAHSPGIWFASYIQTYLERDVRSVLGVRDLSTFRRFLALVASRHAQVLNKTDFAAPLGVSVPTIGQWLGVLETTAQIFLVPPFYESLGKRLVKSPKVYVADSGLACHLLGIESAAELEKSPFLGALLEGFVAAEILKAQANAGRRRELYFFRDQQGLEVDFVLPGRGGALRLLEVKASHTPTPEMARPMLRLAEALATRPGARSGQVQMFLVHRRSQATVRSPALAPGVHAVPLDDLVRRPLGQGSEGARLTQYGRGHTR
jgi:hypothetical protein